MKRTAIIRPEKFAVIKAKKPDNKADVMIKEPKEITLIQNQTKIDRKNVIKIEKGYKWIKFDMVLPFTMVGFIAEISQALAKEKVPIFVLSGYSTDYLLVKEKYLEKTKNTLTKLGFKIK